MKGKIHYTYHIELAEWTGIVSAVRYAEICTACLQDSTEEITFILSQAQAGELEALWGLRARLLLETITTNNVARHRLIQIEAYYG